MSPKNKNYDILKRIDWITVLLTLGLAFFGIIAIASATCTAFDPDTQTFLEYIGSLSSGLPLTQFIYFCLGTVLVVVLLLVDYSNIREFCNIIYWGCVALLVITLIFGANQARPEGMVAHWQRWHSNQRDLQTPHHPCPGARICRAHGE